MLIKLRNEFYQVECDPFANLATELLDIQPEVRRAGLTCTKTLWSQPHDAFLVSAGLSDLRVDIH
ncbi:hypothetical protein GCM10011513_15720 [Franconibacter daqui]|jgi:hypothetical protein|nr:hypothetical protein GCM10011513_15720 [Franconibacter daqui]